MRTRLLATGTAVVAVAAALLPLQHGASAASYPTAGSVTPDKDPFYQAPANLASYPAGAVVAVRPGKFSKSNLAANATQISYRTNDSHQNASLTVTTLYVPTAAWKGTGARPVVSLQLPEDSTGLQCSPSYQTASNGLYSGLYLDGVNTLIQQGWAVAVPDFEGPKAEFMTGHVAGQAVLDGIRAVKNLNQFGVGAANKYALNGYSGGGNASSWAAQLQPTYAPDVTLVGSAVGGTPADPGIVARNIDGGAFSGVEASATVGLIKEYPESGVASLISAKGQTAIAKVDGQCLLNIVASWAFKKLGDYSTVPDPLSTPIAQSILRQNTLGLDGAPVASNPIFDYHATLDEIVPVAQDDTMVKNWCAAGSIVEVNRAKVAEHISEIALRVNAVNAFLADRFAGKKPTNNC